MQNVGPIADAAFHLRPLTLFTGRNSVGKTITSTLLYLLQKSIWNSITSSNRLLHRRLTQILRNGKAEYSTQAHEGFEHELNQVVKGSDFRKNLETSFTEEISRAFTDQRNIIRHRKRKSSFSVSHSLGWEFKCTFSANNVDCSFEMGRMVLPQPSLRQIPSVAAMRALAGAFESGFGGWQDRPIMIPAGRAGITDSYRYLAEQVLLERHGYKQAGPSGITRDFLALLVGSAPSVFEQESESSTDLVPLLFDELLGGQLRPSEEPDELFTFEVDGNRVDRNVMSSMIKELGPMVVLLQQREVNGGVLIIDEPECHLHPRAQIDLARAFVALVAIDARFILSTHSPYLAQSLSSAWVEQARNGKVRADGISVVNFALKESGVTVRNVPYDPTYGFTFDDFADTANDVQETFVRLFD